VSGIMHCFRNKLTAYIYTWEDGMWHCTLDHVKASRTGNFRISGTTLTQSKHHALRAMIWSIIQRMENYFQLYLQED